MNMPVPPYSFPNMPMMQPSFNVFNKVPMAPPLYIGDLDENIHDETLHDFFSKFGPLHFVRIMRDPATGKSRGFGYVNFLYPRDAESARQYAQYEKLGRKHIRIMFKRNVRDLPFEANIFVKNLDPSVTVKDLHNHFAEIGPILCAKVATNSEGQSLGYGYVQFEKKEDAERAFEALQGSKLKESDVQLSAFVSKDKRPETAVKRNIYAKNFPSGLNEDQLTKVIHDVFSQYGEIETQFLKKHPKFNTYSAFICYKDEGAAQKAVDDLHANPRTLDGAEEELYVTWHQGKAERTRDLKRQHQQAQNETNLYVKNLKPEISENDIKKAFQQFGTITSVACKDWTSKDTARKARFGFVAFDNAGDAQRATAKAQEDPEIRNLFLVDATPYIGLHQPKDKRKEYLYSQKKFRSQQAQAQMQTGMMGVPPFGNMPQMPPMAAAGRRFPPFPPMMAQQMRGPPTNRGGAPRPHRGGWSRGGHTRGGAAPRQQGGMGGSQIQQQHPQHPQHPQSQQPQQPRPTGGVKPQMQKPPQATPQQNVPITVQNLRTKLGDFLALDSDKQRQILGELLFPLVKNFSNDVYAPKITGMLIDLSVLEVTEILEFLENPALLQERVQEAVELIQEEDNM